MPSPSSPAEFRDFRIEYQRGLLAWLRAPEERAGVATMHAAVSAVCLGSGLAESFWRAAEIVLQGLAEGRLQGDSALRRLAGRFDQQLRRACAAEHEIPPDLLSETLDYVRQLAPPPAEPEPPLQPRSPLAATLEATAAILPLVHQPRPPRFAAAATQHWQDATTRLRDSWDQRFSAGWSPFRRAVFNLFDAALALHEPDCLQFTEALASASDPLEELGAGEQAPARLAAALAATVECLAEPNLLEHPRLNERLQQLSRRLAQDSRETPRSAVIDRLFGNEAAEPLDHLFAALDAVPPNAALFALSARQLQRLAEPLELPALVTLAGRLADRIGSLDSAHLDEESIRSDILDLAHLLQRQIEAVAAGTPLPPIGANQLAKLEALAALMPPRPASATADFPIPSPRQS
jgi:hypothetical protein